jgi:hypothetical protein
MNNSVTKCSELIYTMNNDQLSQVVDAVQLRRQYLTRQATHSLNIGDKVSFTSSKTGQLKTGCITKVARKYITIDCGLYDVWRVPGNMVERV